MAEEFFTCPRREELWYKSDDNVDFWNKPAGTCSFCGSLRPEDFVARLSKGESIIPTDKRYKAYVGGSGSNKFYFQHLNEEQRRKFVNLYNHNMVHIGYPGYFYELPYFMVPISDPFSEDED